MLAPGSSWEELPACSLALALGGFSLDGSAVDLSVALPAAPDAAAAGGGRPREVAAQAGTLVEHARGIVARVLGTWKYTGFQPHQDAEALATLCFALRSAVGCAGRLSHVDRAALFDLAAALWGAALQALTAGGDSAAGCCPALESMADELYALVVEGGDSEESPDCARFVSFFSRQAAGWAAAGERERAQRCLECAMRHSQALEAQVAGPAPCERQEERVISLFSLYLEGTKAAAEKKQQALANNLLSRAVALSRHGAVGPDAALCCAVGIAELQLAQAGAMMGAGGPMSGLAVALLSASYQQLSSPDLAAAASSGSAHAAGLLDAKKQVLMLLCKAHLAGGDAVAAGKALDALEAEAPGTAAADPTSQALFVEARLAAGRVPEVLRFLVERLRQADLAGAAAELAPAGPGAPAGGGGEAVAAYLAGLKCALCHVSEDSLPSFQSAVSVFVWKVAEAAVVAPVALVGLVQTLLAQEEEQVLCHRLALHVLAGDDVSAALHSSPVAMGRVHAALWHRAVQCFEGGSTAPAKELFAAAFQFARLEARTKNARALAACHSRLGMHQRAAEWLDIAERHEQQPSSLTQLARLQELALTGDAAQAVSTIHSLASPLCPDFHPSLLPALCQAAAKAKQPEVYKEAVSAAVQMLVTGEHGPAASCLPAGQEAALLLAQVKAIDACLKEVPPHQPAVAAGGAPGSHGSGSQAGLFSELASAVKLAAQRLRTLGWQAFAGDASGQGGAAVHALCSLAYNQLVAAQECCEHEHAVALATALVQLLPLADSHLQERELTGTAGQAKVLLLAAQALLDVHSKLPDSPKPLALAAKLQARISQHLASLPAGQHLPLHLLHHCLCLETAARQGDGAAVLHALSKLRLHAAQLVAPQRYRILATLSSQPSEVVRDAACSLLLDSVAAEGGIEAASFVSAMLSRLALPPERQLQALCVCRQLLQAVPPGERSGSWARLCQLLAVHAWNAGSSLTASGRMDMGGGSTGGSSNSAAMLLEEAVALLEACQTILPGGQLQRMRAALVLAGVGQPQPAQPSFSAGHAAASPSPQPPARPSTSVGNKGGSNKEEVVHPTRPTAASPSGGSISGTEQRPAAVHRTPRSPNPEGWTAADAMQCSSPASAASPAAAARHPSPPQHQAAPLGRLVPPAGQQMEIVEPVAMPATVCSAAPASLTGTPAGASAAASAEQVPLPPAAESPVQGDSESDGEEPAGPTWLDAVFAAQKRVLGSGAAGGGQAKRRAVGGLAGLRGGAGAAPAPMPPAAHRMQQAPVAGKPTEDDADALSLGSGGASFMGL